MKQLYGAGFLTLADDRVEKICESGAGVFLKSLNTTSADNRSNAEHAEHGERVTGVIGVSIGMQVGLYRGDHGRLSFNSGGPLNHRPFL